MKSCTGLAEYVVDIIVHKIIVKYRRIWQMVKIAPSLMNMSLLQVEHDLHILDSITDLYHVDIIDGHYVPNMCLTPHFIAQIRPVTSKPIEAHLYVDGIDKAFIDTCIDAGASLLTLPADGVGRSIHRFCDYIHERGAKVGAFINPADPVNVISSYATELDSLLVLSVDPGFTGQKFIEGTYDRIVEAKVLRAEVGAHYEIAIDGGCNATNYRLLIEAGCDVLNLGRGLFNNGDSLEESARCTYEEIQTAAREATKMSF